MAAAMQYLDRICTYDPFDHFLLQFRRTGRLPRFSRAPGLEDIRDSLRI